MERHNVFLEQALLDWEARSSALGEVKTWTKM